MKVMISMGASYYNAYPEIEKKIRELGVEVIPPLLADEGVSKKEIIKNIPEADIYIVGVEVVDREVIDAGINLKFIIRHGAGYDNIDVDYASRKGILVSYAPGQNCTTVAELTMGLILCISRRIVEAHNIIKKGDFKLCMGLELVDKTIGILGFGAIGRELAQRAKAFGMNIKAYDVFKDEKTAAEYDVEYMELDDILSISDYVSVNIPLTKETRGMLDKKRLMKMKKSAFLINTARGEVVNEDDLIEVLRKREIRGAALDVYNSEPPQKELIKLDNVVLTSHIGGSSIESAIRLTDYSCNNVERFIKGEKPISLLNEEVFKS